MARGGRRGRPTQGAELGVGAVASDGLAHGDRQVVEASAQAAPVPDSAAPPSPVPAGGGMQPDELFAPTSRPDEPITAGLNEVGVLGQVDPAVEVLQIAVQQFPHPQLLELLEMAEGE